MLSVRSSIPASKKASWFFNLTDQRGVTEGKQLLKRRDSLNGFRKLSEYENMPGYGVVNKREKESVCSPFQGSELGNEQDNSLSSSCTFWETNASVVRVTVGRMLLSVSFDVARSDLFAFLWHCVKHKSKWENKMLQGDIVAENLSLSCQRQLKEFLNSSVPG